MTTITTDTHAEAFRKATPRERAHPDPLPALDPGRRAHADRDSCPDHGDSRATGPAAPIHRTDLGLRGLRGPDARPRPAGDPQRQRPPRLGVVRHDRGRGADPDRRGPHAHGESVHRALPGPGGPGGPRLLLLHHPLGAAAPADPQLPDGPGLGAGPRRPDRLHRPRLPGGPGCRQLGAFAPDQRDLLLLLLDQRLRRGGARRPGFASTSWPPCARPRPDAGSSSSSGRSPNAGGRRRRCGPRSVATASSPKGRGTRSWWPTIGA